MKLVKGFIAALAATAILSFSFGACGGGDPTAACKEACASAMKMTEGLCTGDSKDTCLAEAKKSSELCASECEKAGK